MPGRRHQREVVAEHGHAGGGPHDLGVVRGRVGAAGRRQDEHGIGAAGHDLLRQPGGLARRRGAGADDDRDVGRDHLAHDLDQADALGAVERRRLAGRAADDDRPHAGGGELAGEGRRAVEVDLAVVVEQRHEGDAHTGEDGNGHACDATGHHAHRRRQQRDRRPPRRVVARSARRGPAAARPPAAPRGAAGARARRAPGGPARRASTARSTSATPRGAAATQPTTASASSSSPGATVVTSDAALRRDVEAAGATVVGAGDVPRPARRRRVLTLPRSVAASGRRGPLGDRPSHAGRVRGWGSRTSPTSCVSTPRTRPTARPWCSATAARRGPTCTSGRAVWRPAWPRPASVRRTASRSWTRTGSSTSRCSSAPPSPTPCASTSTGASPRPRSSSSSTTPRRRSSSSVPTSCRCSTPSPTP